MRYFKTNIKEETLIVVIAAGLFLGSAGYALAQSAGKTDTFYIKPNSANIRSCKSTSCKVVGRLKRNAIITMQTRSTLRGLPQWIRITFKKGNKQYTGYLNKTVLAALISQPTIDQGTAPDTYTPYTPPTIPTQQRLSSVFYDDFSGVFPGNKWIYTGRGENPQIDASIGNPAPSLAMPFPGSNGYPESGKTVATDVNPFNSSNGFSVSMDVRQPDPSPEMGVRVYMGSWYRNFKFEIKHITNQYAYANFEILPDRDEIKYGIYREFVGGGGSYVTAPYMPDANFHNFKFVVDEYGNAKWYRDGVLKNSFTEFPVGDYTIKMSANGHTVPPSSTSTAKYFHNVDNVLVTIP